MTPTDPDLTTPPSEIELAQLLAAVSAALGPSAALVLRRLACERDRLRAAIVEHHAQKADDRCIEDDDRLYAAAGLPPCDRRVGSKADMLANCERFIANRCEGGGPWKSYRELEAEVARLRAARARMAGPDTPLSVDPDDYPLD